MNFISDLFYTVRGAVASFAQANSKAVAGGAGSSIVSYLTARGVTVPNDVNDALVLILSFAIGFCLTWIAPKNQ